MTSEDRDLLASLRRQQAELSQTLDVIHSRLSELEARVGIASLPPVPTEAFLPPIPATLSLPPLPILPSIPRPPAPRPSYESYAGRWFTRLGMLFGVLVLALVLAMHRVQMLLGHAGELAVSAVVCIGVIIISDRLEKRGGGSLLLGRIVGAMALAWLYLTAYAAYYYPPLQVFGSPLIAGILLFSWTIYALLLAKRQKSQLLALFAIALGYAGAAANPVVLFSLSSDLFLAALASAFMLRYGWTTLATVSLLCTYHALLHRLIVDENGEVILDTSRTLDFLPQAVYLAVAWFIFTGAAILTSRHFRGGKRLAFVSLNNTVLAGLLMLTAYIAGYGASAIGWSLIDTGILFLVTSRFASFAEIEPYDIMGAYAAQGLALFGAGTIIVFTGIWRAVALFVETLLLGIAGAFAGDRILVVSTYVIGAIATFFLIWQIAVYEHHPWIFGFGGALVMLINAWSCRSEIRNSPSARTSIVPSTACYSLMAIALVFTTLYVKLNDSTVPPALALSALVLTFAIYYVAIYELPPLAQLLLLTAQALVLFPWETGEDLPWWTTFWVAVVTLILVTWWSRQRITRSSAWSVIVTILYALALAALARQALRPDVDAQGWMVGACFLSVLFLVYGALARVWAVAAVGQIFLFLALYHMLVPPPHETYFWTWWAAALPILVLYLTGRGGHEWLRQYSDFPDSYRQPIRLLSFGYQLLAVIALARWIFGIVPASDQMAAFLFGGTLLLSMGIRNYSRFAVRCSFLLTAIGMVLYLGNLTEAHALATYVNGLAMLLFISQTALLRNDGRALVTSLESWGLTLFAVFTSWVFISAWVWTRLNPADLTMGWALFALFLFLFGIMAHDRRLRWCGMGIIASALVLLLVLLVFHDWWRLSGLFRVLTVALVMFVLLAFGFLLSRMAISRKADQHF